MKESIFSWRPYDWRLNPGPIDGTIDGVIKRSPTGDVKDSVNKLIDNKYEYSVDQFAFWLQESIEGWQSQFSNLPESEIPSLESVDVIAHSAGGATVRSYIQSDAYGQAFDSDGTKLPEIDNFISLGVPYRGASIPWNGLNNNFSGGVVLQLAKLIARAAYAKARNGSTVSLSGQNDVPEAITQQEVITGTAKEFIEDYVPHLRALLATYPFIKDSSGNLKKAEELDPQSRNKLLLDLNDGFDSINNEGSGNPTKFADKIGQLAVVYGSGIAANDALLQKTGPDFETVFDKDSTAPTAVEAPIASIATLDRGKVVPETDEIWYENLEKGTADPQGDQTVPLLSATGFFSNDPNNPNYRDNILPPKDFPSVTHNQQPFDLEVQQYILDVLKIDLEEDLISTNLNETSNPDIPGLAFDAATFAGEFIQDPVEGFLVDNQGRRLGYTSATGAVTEIPNSYWLGEEDGVGFFTEPVEGPFQLELTGLGEDYYVSAEIETEDGPAFLESEGFLAAGEQLTLDVPLLPPPLPSTIRTNAGGEAYTDSLNRSWSPNSGFVGADTFTRANPIAQTVDDVLYQSEAVGNNFSYQQEVENGSYDVTLKFAEVFFNDSGRRVFDVDLEGQTVLDDFDIVESAGGKNIALDRTFNVNVTDGSIDLDFLSSIDKAKVSAIEIKPSVPGFRTNAGGEAYTDSLNRSWSPNSGFVGAGTFTRANPIAQTVDDVLYQSEAVGNNFSYQQEVENGSYDVTLKFAEVFFNDSGRRVFDVDLEGQTVLDDFDIVESAGGKNIALDRTFNVNVTDGSIDLDFLSSIDKAKVSAIEIKPSVPGFRTNAGGEAYTDLAGQLWSANSGFVGAGTFTRANPIAQTVDDVLYQSEAVGNNFSYQQEVENGSYDVTLKFAEVFFNNAGQRVFDVDLEGQTVLDDFDIVESAGGKNIATDRTFNVNVTDGSIDLSFLSSVDKAKVSAIEIKPTLTQLRTNAGGEAYTALGGQLWSANSGFVGAGTFTRANPIAQTVDDVLYQSEAVGNNFSYQQEVENGSYDVTLKFAEVFFNNAGQRVFDVAAEGQTVLDDFDIVESAGGKNIATDRTFTVGVSDGTLDLDFSSIVDKAKVSAIEIKPNVPSFRTNAGGNAYDDLGGQLWSQSDGFVGAGSFARANPIAQTEDDVLYQSEAFGNNFSYQQELENGSYDVTLKFAEVFFNNAGQRVFDVAAEGQTVLDDFDIVESAGGKNIAVDRTFTVGVSDGTLDLDFSSIIDKAKVSAIEIKPSII